MLGDARHLPFVPCEKQIIGPRENRAVIGVNVAVMFQVVIAKESEEGTAAAKPISFGFVNGAVHAGPEVGIEEAPKHEGGARNQNAAERTGHQPPASQREK